MAVGRLEGGNAKDALDAESLGAQALRVLQKSPYAHLG